MPSRDALDWSSGAWSRRRALRAGAAVAAGLALGPRPARAQEGAPLFDADVGLDPGHSRVDVGAGGAGVGEFQHTLDVALWIVPLLEAAGLRVILSRADHQPLSAMSHPNLTERTRIEQAARIQAVGNVRIYVSVHFNALGDSRVGGTETYYNVDNAGPESVRLATALQHNVVAALWDFGYPTADRGPREDLRAGKPYGHFFSLRGGCRACWSKGSS